MAAIITSAKWKGDKEIEVRGQNFKSNPSTSEVKVKNNNHSEEDVFSVFDAASVLTVTTNLVAQGTAGAMVKVMGTDGVFSSYAAVEDS